MKDRTILFGSLAAVLLAAACWVGPLILGAMGHGSPGFSASALAGYPATASPPGRPTGSGEQLAGQWRGTLTVNGEGETTELIVDLGLVAGRWTGQFDLPDFGVEDYPVEVGFAGRQVTLRLSAAQIEFAGELNQVSDALVGLANTRGHRDSLVLRRAGKAALSEEFLRLEALSGDSTRVEHLSATGAELRRQFNQDRAYTRLLMLLSPT